jgi:cytochrome oxidase Cu insertion factor (SCO1/SenC/PrrC family)
MNTTRRTKGRLQFLLIAALFLGPLALAAWLYYGGQAMQPEGRTNHGTLLEPIVNLQDALPGSALHAHAEGRWLLLYANEGDCDDACQFSLYTLRQSRLMLGKEMDRLVRVFLHGAIAPDTVLLAREHAGLVTMSDAELAALLRERSPAATESGGYFLVDPLGNLVMYFEPGIDPGDMVDDIKRLLKLSRIG